MGQTPNGFVFGWGTTVGNGQQDWAQAAVFVRPNPIPRVFINIGTKTTAIWAPFGMANITSLAANFTLTEALNGGIYLSGAADLVVTLPATQRGLTYTLITSTLSTTTGFSLSPNASDRIQGKGITAADNKDIINTQATEAVGDLLTVVGDGSAGWWITNMLGTWAREG
jgi:hypothetical protein